MTTPDPAADHKYTLRQFLIMRSLQRGANWDAAVQAVDKAIRNNPKWDSEEEKTYREWEDNRL